MIRGRGKTSQQGFTIVELLIVVVVIAILATITVVTYNGIQQKAKESRVALQLTQIRKELEMYRLEYDKWPFEDGIRSCLNGTLSGRDQCGTTSTDDVRRKREIVTHFVFGYLDNKDAYSGSSSNGAIVSINAFTGVNALGEVEFCVGVEIGMQSNPYPAPLYIFLSSKKSNASEPITSGQTWCA